MKRHLAAILLVAGLSACGDGNTVVPPICLNIAEHCHEFASDGGTTLAMECHDLGHHGTQTECEMREAECLAECMGPADAGMPDSQ